MGEGVQLEQPKPVADIRGLPRCRKRMIVLGPRRKKREVIAHMHRHRVAQASEESRTRCWHSQELRQEQRSLSR